MKIELLHITPNALELIGSYAGICYHSKNEPAANRKRAVHCKDSGHLSTLRHAIATFHVSGISRVCSHQFVRSKFLDFLQRSQRYCSELDTDFVLPMDKEWELAFKIHNQQCLDLYTKLIREGVRKEDARFVLPEATHTELIVTGNLQAWLDFIKLRSNPAAQYEIREVAKQINNILAKECNDLFDWIP